MAEDLRKPNVVGNGKTEAIFRRVFKSGNDSYVTISDRIVPDVVARFAMELLRAHSLVAAQPDGEDSTGRAKLRREDPRAIAHAACETADAAFAEFRDRGWLVDLPTWHEAIDLAREEN